MLKFIHAADFHLDSAFAALPPEKVAERRREQRELPGRLAEAVRTWGAELALLAGDLFNGKPYPETVEAVKAALAEMAVPVFLAPGNHDFYGPDSPYAGDWPGNVHIFRTGQMESVPLPELGVTVHGAAFLGPTQEEGLLRGFTAAEDGMVHLGVLHGELGEASVYDPVSREDIAALKAKAKAVLPGKIARYAAILGVEPTGFRVTEARTRYGSCGAKNSLSFSCFLMLCPEEAIDLVVVHELCHIRHHDHSPAFYALLASVLPDHRERRKLLRMPREA